MRHTRLVAVLFALAAVATGCGERSTIDPGSSGVGAEELRGRTFLSTAVTDDGRPRPLAAATRVSLRFTDDGRLLADAGCNTMAGPVQTAGGRLAVSNLATTGMGCDPLRHEQDAWLASFLSASPSWRLDGSNLVLTSGDTELVLADRKVAEPDLGLEGTRWIVDTIVDGDVASSTPAGGTASVVFDAGTVEVSTGCNTGSGMYQVSDTALTVGELAVTRKACPPDLMRLEQAVLAALDGEVTFEIDSDRLTLDHPSGTSLQLRGER